MLFKGECSHFFGFLFLEFEAFALIVTRVGEGAYLSSQSIEKL